ncbi:MAG: SurA N-terminal domain-containing protein, partial [Thermoleophilaceae bacterium]|nr:SurA N-terminal domain-containing protein [Thermoleophilaceae bacterium]
PGSRRHSRLRREAIRFLIQAAWVRLEAGEHGIAVSARTVRRAFRARKREAFDSEREYRRFLRRRRQSERTFVFRVKIDLLQERLSGHVTAGAGDEVAQQQALDRIADDFPRKWRARTACARPYVISECSTEVARRAALAARSGQGSLTVPASRR